MGRRELKELALNVNRNYRDAIAGEQIIAQARQIGRVQVVPGTSTHKMQEVVLRKNVLCVIDRAFCLTDGEMKLKKD